MGDKGPCEGYPNCEFCDKCARYVGNIPNYATSNSIAKAPSNNTPGTEHMQNGLVRDSVRCFTVKRRW